MINSVSMFTITVVPQLDLNQYEFVRGGLDRLTKQYIQEQLFYRFVVIQNDQSIQLVRKIGNLKTGLDGLENPFSMVFET